MSATNHEALSAAIAHLRDAVDLLYQLSDRLPTAEDRRAEEERRAWDLYIVGASADHQMGQDQVCQWAHSMLAERRKRWPPSRAPETESIAAGTAGKMCHCGRWFVCTPAGEWECPDCRPAGLNTGPA